MDPIAKNRQNKDVDSSDDESGDKIPKEVIIKEKRLAMEKNGGKKPEASSDIPELDAAKPAETKVEKEDKQG